MMGGNAKADNDSDDEHEQHPWGACSGHGTGQDNGRVVFGRWPRHCHCPNPINNFNKKQTVISQIQLISTKNRPNPCRLACTCEHTRTRGGGCRSTCFSFRLDDLPFTATAKETCESSRCIIHFFRVFACPDIQRLHHKYILNSSMLMCSFFFQFKDLIFLQRQRLWRTDILGHCRGR